LSTLTSLPQEKTILRTYFKTLLQTLPSKRKSAAKNFLEKSLLNVLKNFRHVLSFSSLKEEPDLSLINQLLAKEKRLGLFCCGGGTLSPYLINNYPKDLTMGVFGVLEPCKKKCSPIAPHLIDCILVPALAFDKTYHRLGKGKGHYDRFIDQLHKEMCFPKTIGIGFKEQLVEKNLPTEHHDQRLDELLLS
jgi:5-formyltetrahydrofolate cyclo-ligase